MKFSDDFCAAGCKVRRAAVSAMPSHLLELRRYTTKSDQHHLYPGSTKYEVLWNSVYYYLSLFNKQAGPGLDWPAGPFAWEPVTLKLGNLRTPKPIQYVFFFGYIHTFPFVY